MRVKTDYCNACRRHTTFQYVSHDAYSVIARCEDCGDRFDLINDGTVLRQFRRSNVARIAYYLRKVSEYNAARYGYLRSKSDVKPLSTRHGRLLAYKAALNARLEAERGRCVCKILR